MKKFLLLLAALSSFVALGCEELSRSTAETQVTGTASRLPADRAQPVGKSEVDLSGPLCRLERELEGVERPLLCQQLRPLGLGTFDEIGLMSPGPNLASTFTKGAEGVDAMLGARKFWQYDGVVISLAKQSSHGARHVLYAAHAVRSIQQHAIKLYQAMHDAMRFSSAPSLSPWQNRLRNIVISFDATPKYIAAQTTVLDPSPTTLDDVRWFENVAIVSIDEETMVGKFPERGSRPIYNRPADEENYQLYLQDGLIYSIGHEFLHTYLDQQNSVSKFAQAVVAARAPGPSGVDAEEVIVASSALTHLKSAISDEVRADALRRVNQITQHPGSRAILARLCSLLAAEESSVFFCPDVDFSSSN